MYTRINAIIWNDAKFKSLSFEDRLLFVYLLTCPHRNILGLYYCPISYISADINMTSERVSKGLGELFRKGFVTLDYGSETILINNFLSYNPIENPNQAKAALKALDTLPQTPLINDILELLKAFEANHIKELTEKIKLHRLVKGSERVTQRVSKGLGKQVEVKVKEEVEVLEKKKYERKKVLELCPQLETCEDYLANKTFTSNFEKNFNLWKKVFTKADIPTEIVNSYTYYIANKGKYKNITSFVRNWIDRANKRVSESNTPQNVDESFDAWIEGLKKENDNG